MPAPITRSAPVRIARPVASGRGRPPLSPEPVERHRQQALEALYAAKPEAQAAAQLARLVESNQGAGNYLR